VINACFPLCAMSPPCGAVAAKDAGRTPTCNHSGIQGALEPRREG